LNFGVVNLHLTIVAFRLRWTQPFVRGILSLYNFTLNKYFHKYFVIYVCLQGHFQTAIARNDLETMKYRSGTYRFVSSVVADYIISEEELDSGYVLLMRKV